MDSSEVYRLTGVSRLYGDVAALAGVDLTIHKGEWLSIVGPSGSGKTTLMNILGCLDTPTAGTVLLDGEHPDRQGERELAIIRRRRIGLIFQKFHLVKHLTALENVMVAQYYHSMPDEAEARAALERVGMGARATHLPPQMSGGERQRAALARAVIVDPDVILADEPTGNVDWEMSLRILTLLVELNRMGKTILVATHDLNLIRQAKAQIQARVLRIAKHRVQLAGADL